MSQEQYSLWSWFLVHLCKMMISLGVFFFFIYINFHFSDCYWVKRAKKWTKMTKKFCRLYFKSHKTYIIWLSFMVHLCKMMISPGAFFHFFKILIFWVVRRVKGQKNSPKRQKTLSFALYLRNHTSYDLDLWYACVKG